MVASGQTIFMFVLYMACMMGIGIYFYFQGKKDESLGNYLLGGRGLNPLVAAISAGASDMSGWLLMGLPGAAYVSGYSAGWIGIGLALGTWASWQFVAQRLRVYTEVSGDSITLSDYFENRFRDKSGLLRLISAIFIFIFFFIYTASGFVAGSRLFNIVLGLEHVPGLILSAVVVVAYTLLGGFLAVSWTDLVQGLLMVFALVGVPIGIISQLGGSSATFDIVRNVNPHLLNLFKNPDGTSLSLLGTLSLLAWGLGYPGMPHVTARYMGIRDHKEVRQATIIGVVWVIIGLICAVLIGVVGMAFTLNNPLEGADVEKIFMILIQAVFHPLPAGLFLSAILAAIMSTADSQLLVVSSAFTKDFYQKYMKKDATEIELVKASRYAILIVAVVAFILALNPDSKVFNLVSYAWAGLGATFGPITVLSVYWKDMNRNGALAGMIVGGLTTIIWNRLSGGIFDVYEILPAFIFACIAIVVVSKATGGAPEEMHEEYDKVMEIIKGKAKA